MVKNKYDVVVIGSGIGGLVAGCLLSFTRKVIVLEKNAALGGYCSTFKRGNFNFEAAIHAINSCKDGRFAYDILKACQITDKLKILKPTNLYRAIFPDYDIVVPQENIGGYISMLKTLFPKEKNGIDKVFNKMDDIYIEVDKINCHKILKKSPNLVAFSKLSLEAMLDKDIKNQKLKAIISQYWMYCGLPPKKLSPIHFSYITEDYLRNGGYCVEGGMQKVIDNLTEKIKSNGGDVCSKKEVSKILVNGGKAVGVKTTRGEDFYSDVVISNIDAKKTFKSLTESNPRVEHCLKQMDEATPSISACKIYLGMSVNVKELGITDYEIFVNSSYDLDADYAALLKGEVSTTSFGICMHSTMDSTLCDTDKSVISITILSGYDYWKRMDPKQYKKMKSEIANKLIKRVEAIIPRLGDYIESVLVATPLTMERYTGNSKGAAYGWSRNVHFYGSKHMNIQTPIKNLYLSSNWTKIGGGVEGVMRSAQRTYDLVSNNT